MTPNPYLFIVVFAAVALVFPLLPLAHRGGFRAANVNTGPFGETIANDQRPVRAASQS